MAAFTCTCNIVYIAAKMFIKFCNVGGGGGGGGRNTCS